MDHTPSMTRIRAGIDSLDAQLIELLAERQRLVEAAGRLKRGHSTDAVKAPDRVAEVIADRRNRASDAGLDPDVAETVWTAMIDAFIALELREYEGSASN